MTEIKHTPGEWKAVKLPTGWIIRSVYQDAEGRRCTAYPAVVNCGGQPNEANCHLLAAAPDLLEALQETERRLTQALGIIVEFGDLNGFRNLSDRELGRAVIQMATAGSGTIDQARAAILKATGHE